MAEAERDAFATINADPAVMRHFLAPLDRAASDAFFDRIAAHHASHGFGFCGVFLGEELVGMVGLSRIPFAAHFAPGVEIGWRMASAHQRQGYAEEAARLCLAYAFTVLELPEVVAWTIPDNEPSWRLMEKLGLRFDGLFEEPRIPQGHPKRVQKLYRISRSQAGIAGSGARAASPQASASSA
jgi:ribosomal-protein-alanine N-acetyltransferase